MRTYEYQESLRDLFNKPSNQMATPGAKAGDVVSAFTGKQAMEGAKARGEEMQSEMKGEARAQAKETAESSMASKEKVFTAKSKAQEEMHLADLATKKSQFNEKLGFRNEELDIAKGQSTRATLLAGIGAAIKLGSADMVHREMKKYVEKSVGHGISVDNLSSYLKNIGSSTVDSIMGRKKTQEQSFIVFPDMTLEP